MIAVVEDEHDTYKCNDISCVDCNAAKSSESEWKNFMKNFTLFVEQFVRRHINSVFGCVSVCVHVLYLLYSSDGLSLQCDFGSHAWKFNRRKRISIQHFRCFFKSVPYENISSGNMEFAIWVSSKTESITVIIALIIPKCNQSKNKNVLKSSFMIALKANLTNMSSKRLPMEKKLHIKCNSKMI